MERTRTPRRAPVVEEFRAPVGVEGGDGVLDHHDVEAGVEGQHPFHGVAVADLEGHPVDDDRSGASARSSGPAAGLEKASKRFLRRTTSPAAPTAARSTPAPSGGMSTAPGAAAVSGSRSAPGVPRRQWGGNVSTKSGAPAISGSWGSWSSAVWTIVMPAARAAAVSRPRLGRSPGAPGTGRAPDGQHEVDLCVDVPEDRPARHLGIVALGEETLP